MKPKNYPGWSNMAALVAIFAIAGAMLYPEDDPKKTAARTARDTRQAMEIAATRTCLGKVRSEATFPTKAEISVFDTISDLIGDAKTGRVIVIGRVELMNRVGAMIPHRFHCGLNLKTKKLTVGLTEG